jgi:hypothetical protein
MITSTSVKKPDDVNALNADIREILLEVLPIISPELQLELTNLVQQIHHLNYLIYKKSNSWKIGWFIFNNDPTKFILLLEEIKYILLMAKTNKVGVDALREFRINLAKEINNDRYFLWGHILNGFSYIYSVKSVPFKIFLGLSMTTFLSIIALKFSAQEIYIFDANLHQKSSQEEALISKPLPQANSPVPIPSSSYSEQLKSPSDTINPNRHIFYGLVYAATAGVLGSVASILLRIIDFRDQKYDDPLIPFFIGFFKPLIGLILGIFIFSLISSDTLIKIDFMITQDQNSSSLITNKARQDLFIFSCAFLVGFSERFASDLLKQTESGLIEEKEK